MLFVSTLSVIAVTSWEAVDFNKDGVINSLDVAEITKNLGCPGNCTGSSSYTANYTSCSVSSMGANLMTDKSFPEENGTEVILVSSEYSTGFVGSLNYAMSQTVFPSIPQTWNKAQICNSLECLTSRLSNVGRQDMQFEYLAYGPERLSGVPEAEKKDLPSAVRKAKDIASSNGKKLMIGFSTKQLHKEACERTDGLSYEGGCNTQKGWNNISLIVNQLAPHAQAWIIQAADEYNNPNDSDYGKFGPILSERHFTPSQEWRNEVKRWVDVIKSANPDIEIWIQLALHRIGSGEKPDAKTVLDYREWLVNPKYGPPLVDGVIVSSFYSWPVDHKLADSELVKAFRCACQANCEGVDLSSTEDAEQKPLITASASEVPINAPATTQSFEHISLVQEGWTDNVKINGLTIEPGFYYWIFKNSRYTCGDEGNYEFIVFDKSNDTRTEKNLAAKFPGGGIGFYYYDSSGKRVYFTHPQAEGVHTSSYARNTFFRTSVSEEYAKGITKRLVDNNVKGNGDFRMAVVSYCSHDFYFGKGAYDPTDNFYRWGYTANMEAIDYIQKYFATKKLITFGGSSGAANFFVAVNQDNVAGIIMDSQAADISALRDACLSGISIHGSGEPCYCPEGGPQCHQEFADRIGFKTSKDEPYLRVRNGEVNIPIYLVWNERDASRYAYLEYQNLHNAILENNPGGASVANKVCITNPESSPGPVCNLHVPTGQDYDYLVNPGDSTTAKQLVDDVYKWLMDRVK